MPTLDERVAQIEVKVDAFTSDIAELKGMVAALADRIAARFTTLEDRIDRRFEAVELRFDAIDRRFETVDRRFEAVDRRFFWVIGIQFATLLAIIGGMFGVLTKLI